MSRLYFFKSIRISLRLLLFLCALSPVAYSASNPIYQALPSVETTLASLLAVESTAQGFIPIPFRDSLEANWLSTEAIVFEDIGVQLAEKQFDAFCARMQNTERHCSIPRLIHLIWMGSPAPPAVDFVIASWKKFHPDWEIKLWTDQEVQNFTWSCDRSKHIFNHGKNWAEKSDILRFEILYQFGGIYSDTDVICLKSFEELVTSDITFFAGFESNKIKRFGRLTIGSAIVGAEKNSSVIKRCIDHHLTVEEAPSIPQYIRSGPGPMSKAAYEALEAGDKNILLLPCSYLYPLPWERRLAPLSKIVENIRSESLAIHLWEGSWFEFLSFNPYFSTMLATDSVIK